MSRFRIEASGKWFRLLACFGLYVKACEGVNIHLVAAQKSSETGNGPNCNSARQLSIDDTCSENPSTRPALPRASRGSDATVARIPWGPMASTPIKRANLGQLMSLLVSLGVLKSSQAPQSLSPEVLKGPRENSRDEQKILAVSWLKEDEDGRNGDGDNSC